MERIKRAMSEIGIKEVGDEIFEEMEQDPQLKLIVQNTRQCNIFCGLFGALFFTFGVVAHFGYQYKIPLEYLGLFSLLHVISLILGWVAYEKKNRYMLFFGSALNAIWIALVSLLIIISLFLLTNKEVEDEFGNEIVFHVGLIFYYPLSLVTAILNLILVMKLHQKRADREDTLEEDSDGKESTPKAKFVPKQVSGPIVPVSKRKMKSSLKSADNFKRAKTDSRLGPKLTKSGSKRANNKRIP